MVDFLLDPNIAYLVLVAGALLAFLALLTPGSGFFEIGAFFAFFMAGWVVLQGGLAVNWWSLVILVLGIVPFLAAVRGKGNLWFLGLSILTFVAGSVFLFQGEERIAAVDPILAIVVSGISAGFIWLIATKTLAAHRLRPSHDLGTLIGAVGVARTEIHTEGTIFVNMEDWSARSDEAIPEGARVRVVEREGFILHVIPASEE